MSAAACKEAMCAAWPMPKQETERPWSNAERAVRAVLISSAYLGQAEGHKESDSWKAMIEAIGHTPMTDEQIKTAQAYIHELGDG